MTCGIYLFTCLIDGQQYVGESVNIEQRWIGHKSLYPTSNSCPKLYNALREHGWENFMHYVIEECPKHKLKERERFWVSVLNTFLDGLNSNPGGMGGVFKHSDSSRKKISLANKNRYEDPKFRERRSLSNKKRSRPVIGIHNKTGETICYGSIGEARLHGFKGVFRCLKGLRKTCGGYTWEYDNV